MSLFRIQPTYEELKPKTFGSAALREIGIQPTYEELKPASIEQGKLSLSRIQPTYEELKRIREHALRPSHVPVSSLPMRNWNGFPVRMSSASVRGIHPTYEELKLLMMTLG